MTAKLANARRILVVTKFRYLGDTIVATPFLRCLHEAMPGADVTLLAGPAIPTLLQGCPHVSRVWAHPVNHAGIRQNLRLVGQIRAGGFDAAFLLNRSLHSALVTALAGVPIRIGFRAECRSLLLTVPVPYDRQRPEADCCLDLLRAADLIVAGGRLPELWVTEAERADARGLIEASGPAAPRTVVLVQPGAKDSYRKQWEAARFAEALSELAPSIGGEIALIGAGEEQFACKEVAAAARVPLRDLAGRTSLRQVLALIAEADLLIANDTAMVHAAAALGTPTVTICGPQSVGKWTYGPPHRVVTAPAPSATMDRHANRAALDAIQPEAVIEAALGILAERRVTR